MSLDGYAEQLDRLAAAATDDALWAALAEMHPPETTIAREQLRERLIRMLRAKGISSPARVLDAIGFARGGRRTNRTTGRSTKTPATTGDSSSTPPPDKHRTNPQI
jgi:hypothetical protein